MSVWQQLTPFDDPVRGLRRLSAQYRLVALSNGEQWLLEYRAKNRIGIEFDRVISVDQAGAFKPHPVVYRTAVRLLESEPHQIMMVAAHSFDGELAHADSVAHTSIATACRSRKRVSNPTSTWMTSTSSRRFYWVTDRGIRQQISTTGSGGFAELSRPCVRVRDKNLHHVRWVNLRACAPYLRLGR